MNISDAHVLEFNNRQELYDFISFANSSFVDDPNYSNISKIINSPNTVLLNGKLEPGSEPDSIISLDTQTQSSAYFMESDNKALFDADGISYLGYNSQKYTQMNPIPPQYTSYINQKDEPEVICILDWNEKWKKITNIKNGNYFEYAIVPYTTDLASSYKICNQMGGSLPIDVDLDQHVLASLLFDDPGLDDTITLSSLTINLNTSEMYPICIKIEYDPSSNFSIQPETGSPNFTIFDKVSHITTKVINDDIESIESDKVRALRIHQDYLSVSNFEFSRRLLIRGAQS